MPKVKCEWITCKHNDAQGNDKVGNCTYTGEIYLHSSNMDEKDPYYMLDCYTYDTKSGTSAEVEQE